MNKQKKRHASRILFESLETRQLYSFSLPAAPVLPLSELNLGGSVDATTQLIFSDGAQYRDVVSPDSIRPLTLTTPFFFLNGALASGKVGVWTLDKGVRNFLGSIIIAKPPSGFGGLGVATINFETAAMSIDTAAENTILGETNSSNQGYVRAWFDPEIAERAINIKQIAAFIKGGPAPLLLKSGKNSIYMTKSSLADEDAVFSLLSSTPDFQKAIQALEAKAIPRGTAGKAQAIGPEDINLVTEAFDRINSLALSLAASADIALIANPEAAALPPVDVIVGSLNAAAGVFSMLNSVSGLALAGTEELMGQAVTPAAWDLAWNHFFTSELSMLLGKAESAIASAESKLLGAGGEIGHQIAEGVDSITNGMDAAAHSFIAYVFANGGKRNPPLYAPAGPVPGSAGSSSSSGSSSGSSSSSGGNNFAFIDPQDNASGDGSGDAEGGDGGGMFIIFGSDDGGSDE